MIHGGIKKPPIIQPCCTRLRKDGLTSSSGGNRLDRAFGDTHLRTIQILALLTILAAALCAQNVLAYSMPRPGLDFSSTTSQVLQVWFDAAPQLTIAYPPAYQFNVEAKTTSGLSITSLHWDFGDGSTLDVPFSAQSQVSDIRAHQYTNQTNHCVTVIGYDNAGNTASATVSLTPNFDFTLAASPSSQNVAQGGMVTYTVSVGSSPAACGKPVAVNLTVSTPPPQGVTWVLNPTSGNSSFASTLQVQTAPNTSMGTYTINIVGTSTSVTHTVTVSLAVSTPDFTLSPAQNSLLVPTQPNPQPDRANSTIVTIQSINGFNNPISLSVSGNPNGMTLSFSAPTSTPPPSGSVTSTLAIVTPCSVPPGTYAIAIQGVSGSHVKQATITITVNACTQPFDILSFIWWSGIVGTLVTIPLIFLFLRRGRAAGTPAAIVPNAVAIVQPALPCPICGNPMVFVDQVRKWHCNNGHGFFRIHNM